MNITERTYYRLSNLCNLGIENGSVDFFILSAGRSGSTLLRKHLVTTDKIIIPPESKDWIAQLAVLFIKYNWSSWQKKIDLCCTVLVDDVGFKYWDIDISILKEKLLRLPKSNQNFHGFIDTLYRYHEKDDNSKIIGDKTPFLVYHLDWLKKLFPKAKFIHLLREPNAVISSRIKNFNETIEEATKRWDDATRIMSNSGIHKDRLLEVRYEEFVNAPEESLKRILSFLEIDVEVRLDKNTNVDLGDVILPHHHEIQKKIHTNSVNKWSDHLTEEQFSLIKNSLKDNPTYSKYFS